MKLYYRDFNQGEPTIILHGLYGSSDNWLSIAKKLDIKQRIIIPDLRNHGQSPHSPIHNYHAMAMDIKELISSLDLKVVNIIGHSMGGKVAMEFACLFPENTKSLTVIDIAPKNYNSVEFAHHQKDHKSIISQMLSYDFSNKKSRTEINADFSSSIKDIATRQFILKNIRRNKGKFEWKLNIESIDNNIHNILKNSIDEEKLFNKKCLFIKGEKSDYISNNDMSNIRNNFPQAELISIPNAGHWIHTDNPETLIETLNNFLRL